MLFYPQYHRKVVTIRSIGDQIIVWGRKRCSSSYREKGMSCSCAFVLDWRVQNPDSFKNSCSVWIERSMNRTFSGIVLNMTYKTTFQCCCLKAFLSGSILGTLYEYNDIYFVRYNISAKALCTLSVSVQCINCSYKYHGEDPHRMWWFCQSIYINI